jgi:hypothetical protein
LAETVGQHGGNTASRRQNGDVPVLAGRHSPLYARLLDASGCFNHPLCLFLELFVFGLELLAIPNKEDRAAEKDDRQESRNPGCLFAIHFLDFSPQTVAPLRKSRK